ncbi:ABC transporter substrate-binding protein [Pseudomonas putida]|uniref:ABC transporter, periplasmic substrate-binding protein, aliphatic sulfonates family, putative n=1 Tax=Pseudomonas putida (strain GB-1) TaxID=76869 RepID=B0KSM8_PSEPG|nr:MULTISPECIES: ABC transporter substrate-binding protein [Pseudomonas]ABY98553.1 ABC transporter, periplasmic substrate-binding protein, aliphatic sulfonates family, putative [Pseudomonas putida GB-1]APE98883.1 aliphatic sulfonate ABC transporter substrate-binding protein [Pseudomonas putida]MBP0709712.1 ABC transporter substrate-binding protein [Pseudomonas sp. T34]MCE1001659.1 ABC transporter substrate-binding protein [Pseudomonas sp. NMI1173_11]MCK2189155.1 ABC transporter substrate-bindi
MAYSISRRTLLQRSAAAALAVGLGPQLANASEALRVWRYKGQAASFLADAGQAATPYPLQWVDVPGGAMVLEAFAGNSLDYAFMSPVLPLFASAAGNPLVLIASYQGEQNRSSVIVKRGRGIDTLADLKGKRVSFVRATDTHYLLLNLLRDQQLTLADIQARPMPARDALVAFQNGHLDALVAGGIGALQAQVSMNGVVLAEANRYPCSNYLIATSAQVLQQPGKQAAIRDFLQREKATWAWVEQHPQAWAERNERLTGIPRALYLQQYEQRRLPSRLLPVSEDAIAAQQRIADLFHDSGLLRQPLQVRRFWDDRFNLLLSG